MSQAKERPILFSAPMVRAILEGRKTVTRRPVKIQPRSKGDIGSYGLGQPFIRHPDPTKRNPECPYGRPGDRLWVREAWVADAQVDSITPRDLSHGEPIAYPADGSIRQTGCAMISQGRGRPSIHMPRWASRILLEITGLSVERLQDISDDQAKAEGMVYTDFGMQERPGTASIDGGKTFYPLKPQQAPGWHAGDATHPDQCLDRARWAFANLWEKINGEDSWDANPWVWVVEFRRIEPRN
ncbi:hypothetical protein DZC75_10490 [Pseudomonas parafulva]|uniref:Morphogenetic protein n=1 Tax=Pseudomonas parafulva TaxID=157782 RepID=A0AAI8KBD8_9PSED|nr:hypothetical protein [Pseudomonas parafulva]AXO88404.1 hypothetical protein DZC75_10490 [Pseudomonas parafulva]